MPIIKSAKKRARIAEKAAIRNSKTKRAFKGAIKKLHAALTSGDKKAEQLQREAQSELDKAAKKGVIHKNKAARKKRQLATAAKAASASKPAATKKPAAKKATATKKK